MHNYVMYNYLPSGTASPLFTHTHVPRWSDIGGNWTNFLFNFV